ncbi:MAG TPA: response regulator [Steroidobacteraceae bacterium]|nr:response regulator [Steroidobacteraceae bacterium]
MEKSRPCVAVVDDEESVRRALVRLLRTAHLDAESFASGEAFLSSLDEHWPDCLVLDLQMAGLTGRDVQRQLAIRQLHVPVIVITAHDEPTMREQCLAAGAVDYLRKPLRGDLLLRSIETATRTHLIRSEDGTKVQ